MQAENETRDTLAEHVSLLSPSNIDFVREAVAEAPAPGSVTGGKSDRLIIDDPHVPEVNEQALLAGMAELRALFSKPGRFVYERETRTPEFLAAALDEANAEVRRLKAACEAYQAGFAFDVAMGDAVTITRFAEDRAPQALGDWLRSRGLPMVAEAEKPADPRSEALARALVAGKPFDPWRP